MQRNPYFDNAKAILIFLVILGHTLSPIFRDTQWITAVYLFIYFFHMPAFIVVAGYFTKRIKNMHDVIKLVKKLLVPYIIFQIIYTLYYQGIYGNDLDFSILEPRWALWFLLSLFFWQLMLCVFGRNKKGLLISFVFSLVVGYFGEINETLALSRTFFFFPFFLIGYLLQSDHFERIKQKSYVFLSWLLFAVIFLFVFFYGDIEWREWLYGRVGYKEIIGESIAYGFLFRAGAYVMMLISAFCFFAIVPKKRLAITKIGAITFPIYLFHMFVLKYVQESNFYEWVHESEQYYVLFLVPILTMYLLTRKPIVHTGLKLLEINLLPRSLQRRTEAMLQTAATKESNK